MTIFDIAVICLIALSALLGSWRGIIAELIRAGGLVVAVWLAIVYSADLLTWLDIEYTEISHSVSALILFISGMLAYKIFIFVVTGGGYNGFKVGNFNRSLGMFYGVARGWLAISIFYLMFILLVEPEGRPEWLTGGIISPHVEATSFELLTVSLEYAPTFTNEFLSFLGVDPNFGEPAADAPIQQS